MYANPAGEHERIELEKARLELEQQKAELAATKAETKARSHADITDMADAGSKANQQGRDKVASMAKAQTRRKNNRSTERSMDIGYTVLE